MRRVVVLLATMTVALVVVAGVSLAKPHDGKKDKVTAEPLETTAAAVPTEGLTAPLPCENGELSVRFSCPANPVEQGIAASQARWLTSTNSNTHYWNPIQNQLQVLTTEMISYWETEDVN